MRGTKYHFEVVNSTVLLSLGNDALITSFIAMYTYQSEVMMVDLQHPRSQSDISYNEGVKKMLVSDSILPKVLAKG